MQSRVRRFDACCDLLVGVCAGVCAILMNENRVKSDTLYDDSYIVQNRLYEKTEEIIFQQNFKQALQSETNYI